MPGTTGTTHARLTRESKWWLAIAIVAPAGFGVAAIALFSDGRADYRSIVAIGIMSALAAFVTGTLTGFLFGIPRSRQPTAGTADDGDGDGGNNALGLAPNTNLEQISDWLTKILLGATLTQLGDITDALGRLTDVIGDAWETDNRAADVFAGSLLLYFAVFGFLVGWLFTRAFLAWALTTIDRIAIGKLVRKEVDQTFRRSAGQVVKAAVLESDVEARLRKLRFDLVRQSGPAGPDFVCRREGRNIALEVKHLQHPMSAQEVEQFTTWAGTDGCVLVTDAELTDGAKAWVAEHPAVEVVRSDDEAFDQRVNEAIDKVCQAAAPAPPG